MALLGGGFAPTQGLLSGYSQGGMGGWMPGVNVPFNIYSQVPPISPMMMQGPQQGLMPNVVSLGGQQGQGAQQSPSGHTPSLLGSWNQIFGQNQGLNPSTAAWVNPDTGLTASAEQWVNPDTGVNAGGAGWINPDTGLAGAPVAAGSSGDSAGLAALLKLFMQ